MEASIEETEIELHESWKTKTLVIGAVIGVLVGLGGAYLLIQGYERQGRKVSVSAGEGVKLGILVMGLLRQIANLGDGEK
jgi:hypothetical protein